MKPSIARGINRFSLLALIAALLGVVGAKLGEFIRDEPGWANAHLRMIVVVAFAVLIAASYLYEFIRKPK